MTHITTDSLAQLLGCYFHQDWPDEFNDDNEALNALIESEPEEKIAEGVMEIDRLLRAGLTDDKLRAILTDQVGCYFEPASERLDYVQWLHRVRNTLERGAKRPGSTSKHD
jgi:hypothetical protein